MYSIPEEILLDENVEARKHEYYDVHDVSVTDDGRVVAFSEDCVGSELYSVRIVDAATRKPLLEAGPTKTTGQVEWAADNSTFFYVAQDEKQRPFQVRCRVGHPHGRLVTWAAESSLLGLMVASSLYA